jgi:hypothetical protein
MHVNCRAYLPDDLPVMRHTAYSAVEVYYVQAAGAKRLPFLSDLNRVVAVYGFPVHFTLAEPHAFSVFQVNGWNNYHAVAVLPVAEAGAG